MSGSKALTRADVLGAQDGRREAVEVPEWGGTLWVRTLTASERDAFEASLVRVRAGKIEPNNANQRGRFVALCATDEAGQRLFTDDDAGQIGDRAAPAVERVYEAALRLNGMRAKDVEDARGN